MEGGKKRTLKKSQQLVDEFVDEGIPLTKSGFGDLEDAWLDQTLVNKNEGQLDQTCNDLQCLNLQSNSLLFLLNNPLEHTNIEATDAPSQPQPEQMDEGFTATRTGTLYSLQLQLAIELLLWRYFLNGVNLLPIYVRHSDYDCVSDGSLDWAYALAPPRRERRQRTLPGRYFTCRLAGGLWRVEGPSVYTESCAGARSLLIVLVPLEPLAGRPGQEYEHSEAASSNPPLSGGGWLLDPLRQAIDMSQDEGLRSKLCGMGRGRGGTEIAEVRSRKFTLVNLGGSPGRVWARPCLHPKSEASLYLLCRLTLATFRAGFCKKQVGSAHGTLGSLCSVGNPLLYRVDGALRCDCIGRVIVLWADQTKVVVGLGWTEKKQAMLGLGEVPDMNLLRFLNHISHEDNRIHYYCQLMARNLVFRQRVEDFQTGGLRDSQTQLNHYQSSLGCQGFEYKDNLIVINSPRAVTFRDKYGVQMIMRFNEIHKFSDGTLHQIDEALDYRVVKEFRIKQEGIWGLDTRTLFQYYLCFTHCENKDYLKSPTHYPCDIARTSTKWDTKLFTVRLEIPARWPTSNKLSSNTISEVYAALRCRFRNSDKYYHDPEECEYAGPKVTTSHEGNIPQQG
ncbi:hypothetical protein Tco_0011422 [Tanacetum coccineum]